ncbi:MAG: tetratricopeptide repeat protein [Planctomycetes bacterium]|nr:tetratricopeptide repeat protein [Planctomycetota bacterium]
MNEASAADGRNRIGPYEIVKELGRGGQGVVQLVRDTRLDRLAALKLMLGWAGAGESAIERFRREARVCSGLDDPGICAIYDMGLHEGAPWIVMRYVPGRTLQELIRRPENEAASEETMFVDFSQASVSAAPADQETTGDTTWGGSASDRSTTGVSKAEVHDLVAVVEKVARSLQVAHEAGITHRDIKPGNIMVTESGQPVILDFGLASVEEADGPGLTQTGDQMGTPAYMAPEQIKGERRRIGPRTDVYALGVTLFECVTRRRPFEAATRQGLYRSIIDDPAPSARTFRPELPRDLEVIIACALEKEPDRRYQSAVAFADDLRRFRHHEPIAARRIGPIGRLTRWSRRHPARAVLLLVALLGLPILTGLLVNVVANREKVERQQRLELEERVEGLLAAGYADIFHGDRPTSIRRFEEACDLIPEWGEGFAGLAIVEAVEQDYEAAAAALDRSPIAHPGFDAIRIQLLLRQGRTEEAEALRADTPEPGEAIDFFLRGQLALVEGHRHGNYDDEAQKAYREALNSFEAAVMLLPRARREYHAAVAHARGHVSNLDGAPPIGVALARLWPKDAESLRWAAFALHEADPATALVMIDRALARVPEDRLARQTRAGLLRALGRREEAIAAYRDLASDDGEISQTCQLMIGDTLLELGRNEEAVVALEKATSMAPSSRVAQGSLGRALLMAGRPVDAEAVLEKALALPVNDDAVTADGSNMQVFLGTALLQQGRIDEAWDAFGAALAAQPGHQVAHYYRGIILQGRGDEVGAETALRASIAGAEPGKAPMIESYLALAAMLINGDHTEAGRDLLLRAIADYPENAVAQEFLGNAWRKLNQPAKAEPCYERAIQLDPTRDGALFNVGMIYLQTGRDELGLERLTSCWELARPGGGAAPPFRPLLIQAALGCAAKLRKADRGDEAVAILDRTATLVADSTTLWSALGDLHTRLGRQHEAAEAWRRAVELKEDPRLLDGLSRALIAPGDREEAIRVMRRLLEILDGHDQGRIKVAEVEERLAEATGSN